MLLGREYTGWLHRTALLRTKNTFHVETPSKSKTATIVADPIVFRNFIDSVAFLMDRDITHAAENDKILVFVVSVVANCALSVFLYD